MKVLFTGGGTGGHFYPIIAVAEALRKIATDEKLVAPELYFMAPEPYNERALFEQGIAFIKTPAGKRRRYFSLKNFVDGIKTVAGLIKATWDLFWLYPDVVFSKGAYPSFPAVFAARILKIPVVIHDSDSKPGRANAWAGKFAERIALSYPEAAQFFPKRQQSKIAVTGNPLRKEIMEPIHRGAHEFLGLEEGVPTILILGGSQGAARINDLVIDVLPQLIKKYQIIHQVGRVNLKDCQERSSFILKDNPYVARYKPFDYLNDSAMRMAAGAANLVISRAGSTIFEIAQWGKPSILIPIPETISHDQTRNAFTYAASGGAVVIEEKNLTASIFLSEIERLFSNPRLLTEMGAKAKAVARPDAAELIARQILAIALKHER